MHASIFLFFFFPFVFTWGIAAILFIPYFLPTIIAFIRRSNSATGVFLLNLFLGWTFIGWIISLVWAIASRNTSSTIIVNNNYSNGNQPYQAPPPGYDPPPYSTGPSQATHQTSPTIRRSNQP